MDVQLRAEGPSEIGTILANFLFFQEGRWTLATHVIRGPFKATSGQLAEDLTVAMGDSGTSFEAEELSLCVPT